MSMRGVRTAADREKGTSKASITRRGKRKSGMSKGGRSRPIEPSYRTGRQTQESIVAAAETVLVKFGHAGFTLKRVADAANIAVGNLSYHFPTKDSLLELLIDQTLREYATRFVTLLPKDVEWDAGKLGQLVVWFMDDSVTSRYTHLFRQLWAAALHSPSLNAALDRFYDESMEAVVSALAPTFASRSQAALRTLICFMCVLSEGSTVVFGARGRSGQGFSDLKAIAKLAVVSLAKSTVIAKEQ